MTSVYRGIQISKNTSKNWHGSTKLDKIRIHGAERDELSLKGLSSHLLKPYKSDIQSTDKVAWQPPTTLLYTETSCDKTHYCQFPRGETFLPTTLLPCWKRFVWKWVEGRCRRSPCNKCVLPTLLFEQWMCCEVKWSRFKATIFSPDCSRHS